MSVTVEALERQLEGQKEIIEQHKMAMKLLVNREFKKLILEEFCVQECARYAQLSADPQLSEVERADALGMAQAAGHLRRWLRVKELQGQVAANTVSQLEEELAEARAEDQE